MRMVTEPVLPSFTVDRQATKTKLQILHSLFPNIQKKTLKETLQFISIQSLPLNSLICPRNSHPTSVYYLLEGEVLIEQLLVAERPTHPMQCPMRLSKLRPLLILSPGSLIGVRTNLISQDLEVVLNQNFMNNIRCNRHPTRLLCIPSNIYLDLRRRNTGSDSAIKVDRLLMNRAKQIKRLSTGTAAKRPDSGFSPRFGKTKEEKIVSQNKQILLRRNHQQESGELTLEAPFYKIASRIQLLRSESAVQGRARSVSVPARGRVRKSRDNSVEWTPTRPLENDLVIRIMDHGWQKAF